MDKLKVEQMLIAKGVNVTVTLVSAKSTKVAYEKQDFVLSAFCGSVLLLLLLKYFCCGAKKEDNGFDKGFGV